MMISFASIPLNGHAVARVNGGEALPDGLQELTFSLELKCSQTGEWSTWTGGDFALQGDVDSDDFEDLLRAKIAERLDIDQEFVSERGARMAQRSKLIEQSHIERAAFHDILEAQGESELAAIAKKIFELDSQVILLLTEELNELS